MSSRKDTFFVVKPFFIKKCIIFSFFFKKDLIFLKKGVIMSMKIIVMLEEWVSHSFTFVKGDFCLWLQILSEKLPSRL